MKYFWVALVGYLVDLGLLIILHSGLGVHYLVSASVGFIGGLVLVYAISRRYVFGESKLINRKHEVSLFVIIGLVGLGILGLLMWLLVDHLNADYIVAKLLSTAVVYLWNFFARRALYVD